ncbi:DNA damage-induced apoptosis suppressor protein-like, partial [Tupaia chinensis]|uniref:DNA damage-induced apoptosis suppressor protein-like n=1 Tax=Tupaia chinensis TaxID=246437 RepID=UPI0007042A56
SESSNTKFFSSSIEIKNSYSQHELPCYQHHNIDTSSSIQEKYTWCPPSSLRLLEGGVDSSQDCDPEIWDDLPFSESLNKFLAVIESEIAVTQTDASSREHHVDNDLDKLHTDCSRLSMTPQRTAGAMCTPPVAKRSSQATVKASSSKDNFLSNCKANPGPSIQNKSQSDNTSEAVSISSNRGDILECFQPNTYLSALFSSSKNFKTTVTLKETIKIPPHTNEISLKPSASERDHSYFNLKYFNGHGEKSLPKMNEELRILCSRKYSDFSDLCTLENKQYYRWPKNQGESFTICKKLTYPLET